MKLLYTSKIGSKIYECETFGDIAESFGCIGFTLPGRMLKHQKGTTQVKDEDQKNRSTTDDKE